MLDQGMSWRSRRCCIFVQNTKKKRKMLWTKLLQSWELLSSPLVKTLDRICVWELWIICFSMENLLLRRLYPWLLDYWGFLILKCTSWTCWLSWVMIQMWMWVWVPSLLWVWLEQELTTRDLLAISDIWLLTMLMLLTNSLSSELLRVSFIWER